MHELLSFSFLFFSSFHFPGTSLAALGFRRIWALQSASQRLPCWYYKRFSQNFSGIDAGPNGISITNDRGTCFSHPNRFVSHSSVERCSARLIRVSLTRWYLKPALKYWIQDWNTMYQYSSSDIVWGSPVCWRLASERISERPSVSLLGIISLNNAIKWVLHIAWWSSVSQCVHIESFDSKPTCWFVQTYTNAFSNGIKNSAFQAHTRAASQRRIRWIR